VVTTNVVVSDLVTVEMPEAFDPRWNRIPGITVDGVTVTIDPAEYFFRFENSTWLLCDWATVKAELLGVDESADTALEQITLDFIKTHSRSTSDAAHVLQTAWHVYDYLFREEHLEGLGLDGVTAEHLGMLRQVATFMALNKEGYSGCLVEV
jgi:hypothetical protein